MRFCQNCGVEIPFDKPKYAKYCSRSCCLKAYWKRSAKRRVKGGYNLKKRYRELLIELLGNSCVLCASQQELQIDHIIPVSNGGTNEAKNVQLVCKKCHFQKSHSEKHYLKMRK